jgi:hypothetical protein
VCRKKGGKVRMGVLGAVLGGPAAAWCGCASVEGREGGGGGGSALCRASWQHVQRCCVSVINSFGLMQATCWGLLVHAVVFGEVVPQQRRLPPLCC